jgi:hypothetical protein
MAQRADPATPFVARPGEGRWITDGGGIAPGFPSGQPEVGAGADEADGLTALGPKPKTSPPLRSTGSTPNGGAVLRSAEPIVGCRHHLDPDSRGCRHVPDHPAPAALP